MDKVHQEQFQLALDRMGVKTKTSARAIILQALVQGPKTFHEVSALVSQAGFSIKPRPILGKAIELGLVVYTYDPLQNISAYH